MLEASAEKPGNITPSHDFHDTSYEDMLRSAIAIGPELARAGDRGVGETVLAVVRRRGASRRRTRTSASRCCSRRWRRPRSTGGPLRARLGATLRALDLADARAAYEAIRLATAGGLGERVEHDVRSEPAIGLRDAMASAAGRDSIASEYVTDYALTFEIGMPALAAALGDGLGVREAIVELALRLLDARAGHADRPQARRRGGGAGVRGSTRRARRRRRPHRGGAAGAAELRRLAARAGQRAEPRDDRRPGHRDPVRRARRGYALTPSHRVDHSS